MLSAAILDALHNDPSLILFDASSAAHRALTNDDIFRYIACMLYDMEEPDGMIALARLARTCRAFFDTSIAVLWENIDCIWPLLQTVPGLGWELVEVHDDQYEDDDQDGDDDQDEDDGQDEDDDQGEDDDQNEDDEQVEDIDQEKGEGCEQWDVTVPASNPPVFLERFVTYACRVKHLTWTDGGVTRNTLRSFSTLSKGLGGPWLPCLQSLDDHSEKQPPPFDMLPPTLRRLSFTLTDHKRKLEKFLVPLLTQTSPSFPEIETLKIGWFEKYDAYSDAVIMELDIALAIYFASLNTLDGSFSNLRNVVSHVPLNGAQLSTLAHLPHLTELDAQVTDPIDWLPECFPPASFPALGMLFLGLAHVSTASPLARVIEKIASTELAVMDVTFSAANPKDLKHSREVFRAIADSAFCNALNSFSFSVISLEDPDFETLPPPLTFTMHTFSPLLSLQNLEFVHMKIPAHILTSSDTDTLASAWRNLIEIHFEQDGPIVYPVSVDSLRPFANKCSKLEMIGFLVSAPCHVAPRASVMLDDIVPSMSVVEHNCHIPRQPDNWFLHAFAGVYIKTLFPRVPWLVKANADPDKLE